MNVLATVAVQLKLDLNDLLLTSPRNERIIAHYQREVDTGHMDTVSAVSRCIGDMKGRNYFREEVREVRDEIILKNRG